MPILRSFSEESSERQLSCSLTAEKFLNFSDQNTGRCVSGPPSDPFLHHYLSNRALPPTPRDIVAIPVHKGHENSTCSREPTKNATVRVRSKKSRNSARRTVSVSAKPFDQRNGFEVSALGGGSHEFGTSCVTQGHNFVTHNATTPPIADSLVTINGTICQVRKRPENLIIYPKDSSYGEDTSGVESSRSDIIESDRDSGNNKIGSLDYVSGRSCETEFSVPTSKKDSVISSVSSRGSSNKIHPKPLNGSAQLSRKHAAVNQQRSLPLVSEHSVSELSRTNSKSSKMISGGTVFVRTKGNEVRPLHRKHSSPANILSSSNVRNHKIADESPPLLTVSIRQQSCATSGSEAFFNLSLQHKNDSRDEQHHFLKTIPAHNKVARSISCAASLARKQNLGNCVDRSQDPRRNPTDISCIRNSQATAFLTLHQSPTKTINLVTNTPSNASNIIVSKLGVPNRKANVRRHQSVNVKQTLIDDWITDCHAQNSNYQQPYPQTCHPNINSHKSDILGSIHLTPATLIGIEKSRRRPALHRHASLATDSVCRNLTIGPSECYGNGIRDSAASLLHPKQMGGPSHFGVQSRDSHVAPACSRVVRSKSNVHVPSTSLEQHLYSEYPEAVNPLVLRDQLNNHMNEFGSNYANETGRNYSNRAFELDETENSPPRYTHTPTKVTGLEDTVHTSGRHQQQIPIQMYHKRRSLGSLVISNSDVTSGHRKEFTSPPFSWQQPHPDNISTISSQPHRSQSLRHHSLKDDSNNIDHGFNLHLPLSSEVSTITSYGVHSGVSVLRSGLRLEPPKLPPRPKHLRLPRLDADDMSEGVCTAWCPKLCRSAAGDGGSSNDGDELSMTGVGGAVVRLYKVAIKSAVNCK